MKRAAAVIVTFTLAAALSAQDSITPELKALADAERAFAQAATVKGIRDSFLEFFADDAVALTPDPAPAKDGLRSRPSVPFSERELLWEPRLGDIAASGELGWLTGPSTFTNKKENAPPSYGNYLSIWRKQADGSWKVFIDIGSNAPAPVPFAPGFNRFPFGPRYSGRDDKAAATASLLAADRALNADLGRQSSGAAYTPRLAPAARLHRDGMAAVTGRDAAAAWLTSTTPSLTATTTAAEAARSADFGYTYGIYQKPGAAAKGPYLRVWSRTERGDWLIVAEVMPPPR